VTLLEAMACGTPMVLRENPGFRAVLRDGPEAVFVRGTDPSLWAENVTALIADTTRRGQMGAAGRLRAAEFAWPVVARRELDVYERVIG
jgi:glycosyltransferase involved in cell wall biosynthesis